MRESEGTTVGFVKISYQFGFECCLPRDVRRCENFLHSSYDDAVNKCILHAAGFSVFEEGVRLDAE